MLEDLIAKLKERGLMGVAVIEQWPGKFVAIAVNTHAQLCDPRSMDTHGDPEGAIEDLLGRIS